VHRFRPFLNGRPPAQLTKPPRSTDKTSNRPRSTAKPPIHRFTLALELAEALDVEEEAAVHAQLAHGVGSRIPVGCIRTGGQTQTSFGWHACTSRLLLRFRRRRRRRYVAQWRSCARVQPSQEEATPRTQAAAATTLQVRRS
jgi:hypothetical protein